MSTKDLKDEATAVLAGIGLTVADALRVMLKRVVADKALPFDPLVPNAETIAAMRDALLGKAQFSGSVDALMEDLNARD